MIMDKQQLRKRMLEIRKNLTREQCAAASQKVCHQLLLWDKYISAKRILAYYPCRNELDIRPLLADAFAQGKTVAFPKVTGPGQMVFITVSGFEELKPGAMNIPEPIMSETASIDIDDIPTLMLVPGVAFCSVQKNAETALTYGRMGYGGGYYDRYLRQCRDRGPEAASLITCGIAYDFQIVSPGSLPLEDHDMQLDHLIWG